jgi:hypothetical protein
MQDVLVVGDLTGKSLRPGQSKSNGGLGEVGDRNGRDSTADGRAQTGCVDRRGRQEGIHGDAMRGEFAGQVLGQRLKRGFAGAIGEQERLGRVGVRPGPGRFAASELMLTTAPLPTAIMSGAVSWTSRQAASTLTSKWRRRPFADIDSTVVGVGAVTDAEACVALACAEL